MSATRGLPPVTPPPAAQAHARRVAWGGKPGGAAMAAADGLATAGDGGGGGGPVVGPGASRASTPPGPGPTGAHSAPSTARPTTADTTASASTIALTAVPPTEVGSGSASRPVSRDSSRPESRGGRSRGSRGGAASSAADGIAEEGFKLPAAMTEGMDRLVELHTTQELGFLVHEFGGNRHLPRDALMSYLYDEVLSGGENAYRNVLGKVWEGIIIEYWRGIGKVIRHYRHDLRLIVWGWWVRERAVDKKKQDPWQPVFVPPDLAPRHLVDEKVVDDDRVALWLNELREREQHVKECERLLRTDKSYSAVMDFFSANARLRAFERDGRDRLVVDLQLSRKHHQAANERNIRLQSTVEACRTRLHQCEEERKEWKLKFETTRDELNALREEKRQGDNAFKHRIANFENETRDLRDDNVAMRDRINNELEPELALARSKVQSLTAELDETREWVRVNKANYDRLQRLEHHELHQGSHRDLMYDMYFEMAMELSAEVASLNEKVKETELEGNYKALMIHAEDETRLAMYKNPKAFKDPPRKKGGKKGRGRSPAKKGKGGGKKSGGSKSPKKKGGSKSPSKKAKAGAGGKSKSPAKKGKSPGKKKKK